MSNNSGHEANQTAAAIQILKSLKSTRPEGSSERWAIEIAIKSLESHC